METRHHGSGISLLLAGSGENKIEQVTAKFIQENPGLNAAARHIDTNTQVASCFISTRYLYSQLPGVIRCAERSNWQIGVKYYLIDCTHVEAWLDKNPIIFWKALALAQMTISANESPSSRE